MKRNLLNIAALAALTLCGTTSCEKDLETYSTETCWLNFDLDIRTQEDREKINTFTFAFTPEEILEDTVWLNVKTMGNLADYDRPIKLEQAKTEGPDAQPGVHYVAFDDAELMKKFYYIPAGKVEQKIPIVMKRDASLKEQAVNLYVTLAQSEHFEPGYEDYSIVRYSVIDALQKPSAWVSPMDVYFGTYSVVKHQFMIDVTGKNWDDKFIMEDCDLFGNQDFNYLTYLGGKLYKALKAENARRAAEGLEPLTDEFGEPIDFDFWNWA